MTTQPNRQELDPPRSEIIDEGTPLPPEQPAQRRVDDPDITERIDKLITDVAGAASGFDRSLVRDLIATSLKLIPDGRHTGELKLVANSVKELRYAYRVFGQYPDPHKVTIFGSARTPSDDPDYQDCVDFSRLIAEKGWMVITGAGDGIMKAGHEGPGRESSFGVAIRLPFETTANEVIAGDAKLINFRYFFTRKLMFLSQAEAVVCYPGGFGTMDEAYETLTLVQTGKASMVPIVLCEHEGGTYWKEWDELMRSLLLDRGMISPEDTSLYYLAKSPADAVEHVTRFYRNYHSSRYVRDDLVIRLRAKLREEDVERLTDEFSSIVKDDGRIVQRGAYPEESDHLDLPRLAFAHTRYHFARVRQLIDRINEMDPA